MLTDEQRKIRSKGLGGSDTPIIMGYSSFMTPYELYLEKRGLVTRKDEGNSDVIEWGNKLEPVILNHFAMKNNCDMTYPDTIYHKKYDYIFAHLDGFSKELNAVIEAKTLNSFMKHKLDTQVEDGMPYEYLIQVAKQVMLTEADCGFCAVLVGGFDYKEFIYHRDKGFEEHILEADIKFWERVKTGNEPNPTTIEDYKKKYWDSLKEKTIQANFEIGTAVADLHNIKNNMKQLDNRSDELKMQIMDYMKDKEILSGMDNEPLVTWKKSKKGNRIFNLK